MADLAEGVFGTCVSSLHTAHRALIHQPCLGFRVQLHPGKRLRGLAVMLAGYDPPNWRSEQFNHIIIIIISLGESGHAPQVLRKELERFKQPEPGLSEIKHE